MARKIAVLGGGISGLSAAWNLTRATVPVEVTVYEASSHVGGWMRSFRTEGGAVYEFGPRSLRTAGASARVAMELVSSVGLEGEVLPVTRQHKAAQRRLIYTQQHGLVEVPSNISWLFRAKPPFSKPLLGSLVKELFSKKTSGDLTIRDFIEQRFGKEIVQYLVDPMCRGIYASSAGTLSIQSCFPVLYEAQQQYGSVIRGMLSTKSDPLPPTACSLLQRAKSEKWTMYTLREGLGSFPEALHRSLQERGVPVHLDTPCSGLDFRGDRAMVEVGGQLQEYDHVISTLPSHALASLLPEVHSPLAGTLRSIRSVTVGVVSLEYDSDDVLPKDYREAFGYLVPSTEASRILGVVFDSSTFPQHSRQDQPSTRLTVMLGGEWFESLFGAPDQMDELSLAQVAIQELRNHLGIVRSPAVKISKVHKNCIPMYEVGHARKLDSLAQYISQHQLPLTTTGSFYQGVSVNDCIYNSVLSTSKLFS